MFSGLFGDETTHVALKAEALDSAPDGAERCVEADRVEGVPRSVGSKVSSWWNRRNGPRVVTILPA